MKIYTCEQRTEQWYDLRLGKITGSKIKDVLSKGAGRNTYMMDLVAERLTQVRGNGYINEYMQWGIDHEVEARNKYIEISGNSVCEVGFVEKNEWIGFSPDGLILDDGLSEIKCPKTTTHIEYILKDKVPTTYIPQIQFGLWVTERDWCDFISYDPRLIQNPIFIKKVKRDEKKIKEIEEACNQFIEEMKTVLDKIAPVVF